MELWVFTTCNTLLNCVVVSTSTLVIVWFEHCVTATWNQVNLIADGALGMKHIKFTEILQKGHL